MIEKLRKRIFYIIMISLTTIVIGTIIIYSTVSYRNSINATISMVDRFVKMPEFEKKTKGLKKAKKTCNPKTKCKIQM